MRAICSLFALIARILMAAVFIVAGVNKLIGFDATAQYMTAKGLPMVPVLLFLAAALEIIAGVMLVIGYKTRLAAFVLALFLVPTTILFHNFWDASGGDAAILQIMFFKNLAIIGGLLYIAGYGAGGCAIDACGCKDKCTTEKPAQ